MRRLLTLAVISIAVLFSHVAVFGQDEATKPGYKNGETWVYTAKEGGSIGSRSNPIDGTYELTIVDGKLKIFSVSGAQKDEVDPRPNTLISLLGFARNLNFPLTVGKQWSLEYKGAPIGGRAALRTVTYEVKGIEQITTAAGSFRAFRLESDDRAGPRDYWTTTFWYSPETRSIVKSVFDGTAGGQQTGAKREIELIKFPSLK
jgi:hypothetical protein